MFGEEPPAQVWVDPRLTVRRSVIDGDGLFATDDIVAGTIVLRLGGRIVSTAELDEFIAATYADASAAYVDTITVDDDRHLVFPPGTAAHFVNHCCEPNLWHVGPYAVSARRDIRSGEEVTVDYGSNSGAPGFVMVCCCGSHVCRGEVSSNDWRIPELQARYRGHWVPALEDRISGLRRRSG
jgi:SET domain-containing protein